jgi:glycosyltransferase involved in cell wall biosynthesis
MRSRGDGGVGDSNDPRGIRQAVQRAVIEPLGDPSTTFDGERPPEGAQVLVATLMPASGPTGVQTHLREVCDYLTSRGNQPLVVTPRSWGRTLTVPVFGARLAIDHLSGPASVAWYRYWHYVFLKQALRRELRGGRRTVVYAQCALAAKAALEVRTTPEQKVVVAIHSDGSQADEWVDKKMLSTGNKLYGSIVRTEQQVLTSVDGIVYVSEAARAGMARHVAGIEHLPSVVVPNFISVEYPDRRSTTAGRRNLVTVGGLEIHKNHEYLLRVIAAANRRDRRYTLDLVGDGPCRRDLEKLARELGLEEQVRFLGSRGDVREILPGYRAYVHTSQRESLCMAIIEAMACGLPVVAGAIGGIPELFEPGHEGLFWPLDDADAAAAVLYGLLDDEQAQERLGASARSRFERCFDSTVVGPVLEKFLNGIVSEGAVAENP